MTYDPICFELLCFYVLIFHIFYIIKLINYAIGIYQLLYSKYAFWKASQILKQNKELFVNSSI